MISTGIKNLRFYFFLLGLLLVSVIVITKTNIAQAKDIYFGSGAKDNINVVGNLCLGNACHPTWPSGAWLVSGNHAYYSVNNGNVGIGVSNPTAKLSVSGLANFSDLVTAFTPQSSQGSALATVDYVANVLSSLSGGGVSGAGTNQYLSRWTNATTLANSVFYDNGTNVGTGTTNPTYTLHINQSTSLRSTGNTILASTTGNVGFKTTSPRYKLEVNGGARGDYFFGVTPQTSQGTAFATVEFVKNYVDAAFR